MGGKEFLPALAFAASFFAAAIFRASEAGTPPISLSSIIPNLLPLTNFNYNDKMFTSNKDRSILINKFFNNIKEGGTKP